MSYFKIITDSPSNLTDVECDQYDILMLSNPYVYNSEEYNCYEKGRDYAAFGKQFYDMVRSGAKIRTSLINQATLQDCFESYLKEGVDILFIGMSSGLTGTCQQAREAAEELMEQYENRIVVVDSLGASLGEGLMVVECAKMRAAGKTIDEAAAWFENNRLCMRHIFTVDDLKYLKEGGRISSAVAIAGTLLGIKPMLYATDEGKIGMSSKVRGRKKSLECMANDVATRGVDLQNQTIGVAHCDAPEDAKFLIDLIKERTGVSDDNFLNVYYDVCSGTHVGPGAIAVFFFGNDRSVD